MPWTSSAEVREESLLAACANWDGGILRFYSGTMPADVDAALSGNTVLGEVTLQNPAVTGGAVNGIVNLAGLPLSDTSANAAGICTFCRFFKSDGTTVTDQMNCGITGSGADVILSNTNITAGQEIRVIAATFTQS